MRWLSIMLAVASIAATTQPAADPFTAATTPSQAIEAYARAPNADDALKLAFIRKMVDFGTPQLAEAQAQDLINRGVHDPLAIGVAAFTAAARNEMGAAVQQLRMALQTSADEPFLLRTAGQLIAWYDTQSDRSQLTATDVQALEWLRTSGAAKPAFADAYRAATSPMVAPPVVASSQAQAQPQPVVVEPPPQAVVVYSQPQTYLGYGGYIGYPIYSSPFICEPNRAWRPIHSSSVQPLRRKEFINRGDDHRDNRDTLRPPPVFRGYTPQRSAEGSIQRGSGSSRASSSGGNSGSRGVAPARSSSRR